MIKTLICIKMTNSVDSTKEDETASGLEPKENETDLRLMNDIWMASRYGNVQRLREFVATKESVNKIRWSGITPLHRAVENKQLKSVEFLLENGADVNARTTWGWYTPLHVACKRGYEDIAKFLLLKGADWMLRDKKKFTPMKIAIRSGHASMAQRLDEYNKKNKNLDQPAIAAALLNNGMPLNTDDKIHF